MTPDEIRERIDSGSEVLWWTYRLFDVTLALGDRASDEERAMAVDCFLRLATTDPEWAMSRLHAFGPQQHALATLFSAERLGSLLERLHLGVVKHDAMLRARLLNTWAKWRKESEREAALQRAWVELQRVPEGDRDEAWSKEALIPASVSDYSQYRQLAASHLSGLTEEFWRSSFLPDALEVAARHRDWPTFERWLQEYRSLHGSMRGGHAACAVICLEGLRALDEGRTDAAVASMRALLELAPKQEFLSNKDISTFPGRLRSSGLCSELCDQFDALVDERDWRRRTRGRNPT